MTDSGETRQALLDRIVRALEPYDIPSGRAWSDAERVEPAEKVLAALGLEQVGWFSERYGLYGLQADPEVLRRVSAVHPMCVFGGSED